MSRRRILVVDDEKDICELVKDILEDEGFEVYIAQNAHAARAQLAATPPDLVLLDIWMPDEDGISLLKDWQENSSCHAPIIIMSGHGTVETAMEATRLGACNFIEKPLTTAKLLQSVRAVLTKRGAAGGTARILREPVGTSVSMRQLREQARQLADSDAHVSIIGETGTGKATLAEYIHYRSARADAPLTIVHGTSLNEVALDDALAGTTNGSLLIKQAHELTPACRKALSRSLSAARLAAGRVRLMTTSLHGIDDLVKKTGMVQTVLEIVPIRAHTEDIPELANACTDYLCQSRQLPYRRFSIAAQNRLLHHNWPGNLSELNALVCELLENGGAGEISLQEVEALLDNPRGDNVWLEQALGRPLREAREMFERFYLKRQLEAVGGSVSQLAAKAGMERTHLYRKLRLLGIELRDGGKP